MDPVIEYYFGTGDGPLTHWQSTADVDADGDGTLDAVGLDFDGDGLIDDLMWDSDGDGVADLVALDFDDDGVPEARYADSGRGLWDLVADGPPTASAPTVPTPTMPGPAESMLDTDGDGTDDIVLVDTDGDGYADTYRGIDTATETSDSGGPSTR